jgi:hypothetical protein
MALPGREEHRAAWMRILDEGGWHPRCEETARDDIIIFKHEGKTMVLSFEAHDPVYVRLILPNFFSLREGDLPKAYEAAHKTTSKFKLTSVHITESLSCSVNVETLQPQTLDNHIVYRMALSAHQAASHFARGVREQNRDSNEQQG